MKFFGKQNKRNRYPLLLLRKVTGTSMVPFLFPGDMVVFSGLLQSRQGRVVIADVRGREVVKRISHVQGNRCYLLGDNPASSTDSRDYGFVSRETVKGGLLFVLRVGKHR